MLGNFRIPVGPLQHSENSSKLSTLLPDVVQDYLKRLPSLIKSTAKLPLANKSKRIDLCTITSFRKKESFGGMRPSEPDCRALIYSDLHDKIEESGYYSGNLAEEDGSGRLQGSEQVDLPKAESGDILWKFAHQGLSLLNIAVSECASSSTNSLPFARQLYIHSLTYLMRALPPDLTVDEKVSIRAALPEGIANPPNPYPSNLRTEERPTSFLHRTLASTIVQLFILFQFLLPYVRILLAKAWAYEKEHRIIVRVTIKGVGFGMCVGEAMKGMGQGKMGEMFFGAAQWMFESIIGGVGEGLVIVDALRRKDVGDLFTTQVINVPS